MHTFKKPAVGIVILLATAVASLPLAAHSEPGDVAASAGDFLGLLANADFAGAVARFDATMKQALPEARLREAWQEVQVQAGPFKKQVKTRAEKTAGYDVALVTCEFERASLDAKDRTGHAAETVVADIAAWIQGLGQG
jgi:hypothetical protein